MNTIEIIKLTELAELIAEHGEIVDTKISVGWYEDGTEPISNDMTVYTGDCADEAKAVIVEQFREWYNDVSKDGKNFQFADEEDYTNPDVITAEIEFDDGTRAYYAEDFEEESILKYYRRHADLSQSQLAKKSGVSIRTIQAYESGAREISGIALRTAVKLAEALDIKPEDLLN